MVETTPEPIEPTIVTDPDSGRGDSLGGYPSDYKSIVYVEDKSYHKVPLPYKSYEFVGAGKKMAYDMTYGNEVEKSLKIYKEQVGLNFLKMQHSYYMLNAIRILSDIRVLHKLSFVSGYCVIVLMAFFPQISFLWTLIPPRFYKTYKCQEGSS